MHSRITRQLAIGISALILAFGTTTAWAQSTKGTINASTITTYPPFESKDPATGKLQGFDIDLLEAIAAKMGAKVNWTQSSFEQLLPSIQTKRADVVISGMGDTPQRRETISFVDYFNDPGVFAILRTNAAKFPNEEALCGKGIAMSRASTPYLDAMKTWNQEHCIKAGKPPAENVLSATAVDALLQMSAGRADAAVQSSVQLAFHNAQRDNQYAIVGKPLLPITYGIGFAKDDPQLGQALKAALISVIADGTYLSLMRKWKLPEDLQLTQPTINGEP